MPLLIHIPGQSEKRHFSRLKIIGQCLRCQSVEFVAAGIKLLPVTQPLPEVNQVAVGFGMFRIEREGPLKIRRGGFQIAILLFGEGQIQAGIQ